MKILSRVGYRPWYERPLKAYINASESGTGLEDFVVVEVLNGEGVVTNLSGSSYHNIKVTVDGFVLDDLPSVLNDEKSYVFFDESLKVEAIGNGSGNTGSVNAVVRVMK